MGEISENETSKIEKTKEEKKTTGTEAGQAQTDKKPAAAPKKRTTRRRSPRKAAKPKGTVIYIGKSDPEKRLKTNTAYMSIPEGADAKLFIPVADYAKYKAKENTK